MANIIVDEGNTCCKIAVMEGVELRFEAVSEAFDEEVVREAVERFAPAMAAVASTRGGGAQIAAALRRYVARVMEITAQSAMPVAVAYATPQTLGVDRVAVAVGVERLYGRGDALIIDMGSAITIDLLEDGVFRGGNISAGVAMRLKALHDYTAALPLVEVPEDVEEGLGRSTREALERGVMQGVLYEIEGYAARFLAKNPKNRIFFSGGDAKRFVNRIKSAIFAGRNVMYVGLNTILEYNAVQSNI